MSIRPKLELTAEQKAIAKELGSIGGKTRAKKLTAERRLEIARNASQAAARIRTKKAKERKTRERKQEKPD